MAGLEERRKAARHELQRVLNAVQESQERMNGNIVNLTEVYIIS